MMQGLFKLPGCIHTLTPSSIGKGKYMKVKIYEEKWKNAILNELWP